MPMWTFFNWDRAVNSNICMLLNYYTNVAGVLRCGKWSTLVQFPFTNAFNSRGEKTLIPFEPKFSEILIEVNKYVWCFTNVLCKFSEFGIRIVSTRFGICLHQQIPNLVLQVR